MLTPRRSRLVLQSLEERTVPAFVLGAEVAIGAMGWGYYGPALATGDLDGDGTMDVVAGGEGFSVTNTTFTVLMGNGGGFTAPTTYTLPHAYDESSVTVGDLDGDGLDELVVVGTRFVHPTGYVNDVFVYQAGSSGLILRTTLNAAFNGYAIGGVVLGQFTGDSKPDLAVIPGSLFHNQTDFKLGLLKNNGNLSFTKVGTNFLGNTLRSTFAAKAIPDVNGDGLDDLVLNFMKQPQPTEFTFATHVVHSGSNGFTLGPTLTEENVRAVSTGDLDGDGQTDLTVETENGTLLFQGHAGSPFTPLNFTHPDPLNPGANVTDNRLPRNVYFTSNVNENAAAEMLTNGVGSFLSVFERTNNTFAEVTTTSGGSIIPDPLDSPTGYVDFFKPIATTDFDPNDGIAGQDMLAYVGRMEDPEGDGSYISKAYLAPLFNVPAAPTTLTVTPSASPSVAGNEVTFTFEVSSSSLVFNGTIRLLDGTSEIGTATIDQGVATITLTPDPGTHHYTATYEGSEDFQPSEPVAFTHDVRASATELISQFEYLPMALPQSSSPAWMYVDPGPLSTVTANGAVLRIQEIGTTDQRYYELNDAHLSAATAGFIEATFRISREQGTLFAQGVGSIAFGFSDGAKRMQLQFARLEGNDAIFVLETTSGPPQEVRLPNADQWQTVLVQKLDDGSVMVHVRDAQGQTVSGGTLGPVAATLLPDTTAKNFLFGAPSASGMSVTEWRRVQGGVGRADHNVAANPMTQATLTVQNPLARGTTYTFSQGDTVGVTLRFPTPTLPPESLDVVYGWGGAPGEPSGKVSTAWATYGIADYAGDLNTPGTEFEYQIHTQAPGGFIQGSTIPFQGSPLGNAVVTVRGDDAQGRPYNIGPAVFYLTGDAGAARPEVQFSNGQFALPGQPLKPITIVGNGSSTALHLAEGTYVQFVVEGSALGNHTSELFYQGTVPGVHTYRDANHTQPATHVQGTAAAPPKLYVQYWVGQDWEKLSFTVKDTTTLQANTQAIFVSPGIPRLSLNLSKVVLDAPTPGNTVPLFVDVEGTANLRGTPTLLYKSLFDSASTYQPWPKNPVQVAQRGERTTYRVDIDSTFADKTLQFMAMGVDSSTNQQVASEVEQVTIGTLRSVYDPAVTAVQQAVNLQQPSLATNALLGGGTRIAQTGDYVVTQNQHGQMITAQIVAAGAGAGIIASGAGGIVGVGAGPGIVGVGAGAGIVGVGAGIVGAGAGAGIVAVGAGAGLHVHTNDIGIVGVGAGAGIVGVGAGAGLLDARGYVIGTGVISKGNGGFQPSDTYIRTQVGSRTFWMLNSAYGGIVGTGAGGIVGVGAGAGIHLPGGSIIAVGAGGLLSLNGVALQQTIAQTTAQLGVASLAAGIAPTGVNHSAFMQSATQFRPPTTLKAATAPPVGASPLPESAAYDTLLYATFLLDHAERMRLEGDATFQARMTQAAKLVEAGRAVLEPSGFDGLTEEQRITLLQAATIIPLDVVPLQVGGSLAPGARVLLTAVNGALLADATTHAPEGTPLVDTLAGVVVTIGGEEPVAMQSSLDNPHIQLNGQTVSLIAVAPDRVEVRLPTTLPVGKPLLLSLTTPDGRLAFTTITLDAAPLVPKNVVTVQESDGDRITVKLTGPGSLGLFQTDADGDGIGPVERIQLAGTSATKSKLSITVTKAKTGDGFTTVGEIVGGDLKALSAAKVNISGSGLAFHGYVGSIVVRDVLLGADIVFGGTPLQRTSITAHDVGDGTGIVATSSLGSLTAARIGNGYLQAPSVAKFIVKGDAKAGIPADMKAAIVVTGEGVKTGKNALGTVRVSGTVANATIQVAGHVGAFTAGQLHHSSLLVGFTPTDIGNPFAGGGFYTPYKVGAFTVTGLKNSTTAAFDHSFLVASTLGKVTLRSVDIAEGTKYGLLADSSITRVRLTDGTFTYDPKQPAPQVLGDFEVRLV